MPDDGARRGPLISALGAAALGFAVFQPWYGLALTQAGVESAQHALNGVAQQYGNSALRSLAGSVTARFGSLAGAQLGTVSAHDAFKDLSVVFLLVAGVGLIAALLDLANRARSSKGLIAVAGTVALIGVVYRMAVSGVPSGGEVTLSLQWGAWLALAGSAAMIAGTMWPSSRSDVTRIDFSQPLDAATDWTSEP